MSRFVTYPAVLSFVLLQFKQRLLDNMKPDFIHKLRSSKFKIFDVLLFIDFDLPQTSHNLWIELKLNYLRTLKKTLLMEKLSKFLPRKKNFHGNFLFVVRIKKQKMNHVVFGHRLNFNFRYAELFSTESFRSN